MVTGRLLPAWIIRIILPRIELPPGAHDGPRQPAMIRLALLLTLLLATTGQAADKGFSLPPFADDLAAEFRAVGRVNSAGFNVRGNCTGTLIRPDVVLTAGHCAGPVRADDDDKARRMFVAGWSRGDYVDAREIVGAERHPAYRANGRHDPRFDVGLLFLESPITQIQPLILAPHHERDQVVIAGYHHLIPHLLTGRLDCPVLTRYGDLLRIDCPVISGNSGGPVLEPDGAGGWQVTAVVSSQEKRHGSLRAIAVRIPQWVHDALAER